MLGMALFDDDTTFNCIICGEEVGTLDAAKAHAMDEHADDIIEEEFGHYFSENDG